MKEFIPTEECIELVIQLIIQFLFVLFEASAKTMEFYYSEL